MSESGRFDELLACPRCDKTPLKNTGNGYRCDACKVDYPLVGGIPWLFAEPDASLGEWRGRLHFEFQTLSQDINRLDADLKDKSLPESTRKRLELLRSASSEHRNALRDLLAPIDVQSNTGGYESYLALRTRLPSDQGLHTYYQNVHRDWGWGDEENAASVDQIKEVAARTDGGNTLGDTLVLGAGAGRLAYDIYREFETGTVIAVDFNPLLLLIADRVSKGESLELYEFPLAPRTLEDVAVKRELSAPEAAGDDFRLVLGDVLRPSFAAGQFDTVISPWLIDIVSEDLSVFSNRINALLKPGGRWINFGSLAFEHPRFTRRYSQQEALDLVTAAGFGTPETHEAVIPYMCSPASRHGRQETVFSFAAVKTDKVKAPPRHKALPDWIVTGKEPVPALQSFRTQAMTTQIYGFMMSLIDGKRSIADMAKLFEQQQLMSRQEAEPAIRNFLIKMFEDSERQSKLQ